MKRILLIACLAVAPVGANAQYYQPQPQFQPRPFYQPYMLPPPVQMNHATTCSTNYVRQTNGQVISAFTNCQ